MKKIIKKIIYKLLPSRVENWLREVNFNYHLKRTQLNHKNALINIRKKEKITVAFFLIHESVWKYEELYKLMEKDNRFNPIVVVCPYLVYGDETMLREMDKAYENFHAKGYNVIKSLNETEGEWINVKKVIKPDVVFFTNPHYLTRKQYYITNFLDTLTCYVPYGVSHTHLHRLQHDLTIHNFCWTFFVESEVHKIMSIKYARNKGNNVIVSGYPGYDSFFNKDFKTKDVWLNHDCNIKRIIWAPHHTLDEDKTLLSYSNFIAFADLFLLLPQMFDCKIQIAFKPHPILKDKLYEHENWGKQKTDIYYQKWQDKYNCQLNESEYVDLFLTSDAMILDSGSFLNEYLATNKPSLFLMRDEELTNRFNDYGKMAFANHYHGRSKDDIINFINDVVINGKDSLKEKRTAFINTYQKPQEGNSASENIFNFLKEKLN